MMLTILTFLTVLESDMEFEDIAEHTHTHTHTHTH